MFPTKFRILTARDGEILRRKKLRKRKIDRLEFLKHAETCERCASRLREWVMVHEQREANRLAKLFGEQPTPEKVTEDLLHRLVSGCPNL